MRFAPARSAFTVGRREACDVGVSLDFGVSERHAEIRYRKGRWEITDVGSSNGTEVDGVEVRRGGSGVALRHGSVITLGEATVMVVSLGENGLETAASGMTMSGTMTSGTTTTTTTTTTMTRTRTQTTGAEFASNVVVEAEREGDKENAGDRAGAGVDAVANVATKSVGRRAHAPKPPARKRARGAALAADVAAVPEPSPAREKSPKVSLSRHPNASCEASVDDVLDVPSLEAYARSARDAVLASIRDDARSRCDALRARARDVIASLR